MSSPLISKSKYLCGLQCPKLLWVLYNDKDRIPPTDQATQAVFDQGHEVGLLAQQLFPDGIAVPGDLSIDQTLARTAELLAERKPMFEAGFAFKRGYCRLDVLAPNRGGTWDIIEVKSGTSVKDPNWDDVAFQRWCCEGAGVPVRRCHVMHVDNGYVLNGAVDPEQLFAREDVTDAVAGKAEGLEARVDEMARVIERKTCPKVEIGPHCGAPYTCPLMDECWKAVNMVKSNVFTLTRLGAKAWTLYQDGVVNTRDIPASFKLSDKQLIQQKVERTGKPHVDKAAVREFLDSLTYPLHLLDFETFAAAVPKVEGTRPYQQVPFQLSLHVAASLEAEPAHRSWIWDGEGDPRALLLEQLSAGIGKKGNVIAYNAGFETARLKESVEAFPRYSEWLKGILERVVDLLSPFRSFDVYCPGQHGSASLKAVLPALTGRDYSELAIHEGGQASLEFMAVAFGQATEERRREVWRQLEEYCGLDTMGMLRILRALTALR